MTRSAILPALLLLLASGLGGCAHVGPAPRPLPSQTPGAFAETVAAPGGEAGLADWWRRFGDPVLDDLVVRTASANLDLQQTGARIEQARQQEVIAGARRLPQVNADVSASRNRISENAISIPPGTGGGAGGGGGGTPFGIAGSEFNSFRLGADASWELDLFGGVAAGAQAAVARRQGAEWSRRDLQAALVAETASRYLDLRSLQRREAIARDESRRLADLLSIARSRAQAGVVSGLDPEQQAAQLAASEARIPAVQGQIRAEIHALGVLAGEPPEALTGLLAPPAAAPPTPPVPPAGLPSELLRRRPDIRRAEREVAAAAAETGVAAADLYPRITLSAQPGMVSTALSSLLDWGSRNYSLGAGLLWPIFDGGRARANLAKADARQTETLLAYRKTVLTAMREVEDALSRWRADEDRRVAQTASLDSARRAEGLARDQFGAGLSTYAPTLAARQAVIAAEDQLAEAEAAQAQDIVALYRALGGGWSDPETQEARR